MSDTNSVSEEESSSESSYESSSESSYETISETSSRTIYEPPMPIGVKVHPINVGQGDAILLEVEYEDGSSKKYLIDGGRGQEDETKDEMKKRKKTGLHPLKNLIVTLRKKDCIQNPVIPSSSRKTPKDCEQIVLESIVVTHPDIDHYRGINQLLKKFTICCPIITTLATKCVHRVRKRNSDEEGSPVRDEEHKCPQFHNSQESFPLQKYTGIDELPKNTTVTVCPTKPKVKDCNATSILTTVKLPHSNFDYDVVLTGDSYGEDILRKLQLKKQNEQDPRKSVGIFQVPHHGSKCNSTTEKKDDVHFEDCRDFYELFDADIYLISHGGHGTYNHPDPEVIKGIVRAAVKKKRQCIIVVTATWFDMSKIKSKKKNMIADDSDNNDSNNDNSNNDDSNDNSNNDDSNDNSNDDSNTENPNNDVSNNDDSNNNDWKKLVKIYCFKRDTPYVCITLDPEVQAELPSILLRAKFEATRLLTAQCIVCNKGKRVPDCRKVTPSLYVCKECRECQVCGESTPEDGSKTAVCNKCHNRRVHANGICTVSEFKAYCCSECRGCVKCNEATSKKSRKQIKCHDKRCHAFAFFHNVCKPHKYTCINCKFGPLIGVNWTRFYN